MSNVLFLVHRIPFPPDKGDKIRSYHLLMHLAQSHRVFLGTFIDDAEDERYVGELTRHCAEVHVGRIGGWRSRVGAAMAGMTGKSLSVGYYRDEAMQSWVTEVLQRERIDAVIAFSSTMAQYFPLHPDERQVLIADLVDVDSDKWRQYAKETRAPRSWLYRYEAAALAKWESGVVKKADATSVVSEAERSITPLPGKSCSDRIKVVPNGVDAQFFDPEPDREDPYSGKSSAIVFTGAMDYHANVDGVCWFADTVWPALRQRRPEAEFWIVGNNPAPAVKALDKLAGITVTGRVPDVRPYLRHAAVAVAPLRLARGVQNKVLEALAMGLPVVASPQALQGLQSPLPQSAAAATTAEEFGRALEELLSASRQGRTDGRDYVRQNYNWQTNLDVIGKLIPSVPGDAEISSSRQSS